MKRQEPEHRTHEAKQAWEKIAKLIQPTAIDIGEPLIGAEPTGKKKDNGVDRKKETQ